MDRYQDIQQGSERDGNETHIEIYLTNLKEGADNKECMKYVIIFYNHILHYSYEYAKFLILLHFHPS
jgi:hypothetical protein